MLPVLDRRHHHALGRPVTRRLVRDHDARWTGLLLQQLAQQTLGGLRVASALHQDVQHGLVGEVRADVDLSYLSDTIILTRFFEAAGAVRRGLSVVKTRISNHEPTIREFSLGPTGVVIGDVLRDFDGVLNGTPVYRGSARALMETPHPGPVTPPQVG